VHQEHRPQSEAAVVREPRVLGDVGQLVRQEHDPGRLRQPREQADQAHLRAIVRRQMGVGIATHQDGAGRRAFDQPGAKGRERDQIQTGGDLFLRGCGRQTHRDRHAGTRVIGNQMRDLDPPPRLQDRIDLGAGRVRRGRRGADRRHRGDTMVGGPGATGRQQAGDEPGEDTSAWSTGHGGRLLRAGRRSFHRGTTAGFF
jgi:hypothetical protein